MRCVWQAMAFGFLVISASRADEAVSAFAWGAPLVTAQGFTAELDMLDPERDDYATSLAILASNTISQEKASPASIRFARRLLGLALHLSPRNKKAVIVNFQLTKGMTPALSDAGYEPKAFARILMTRGEILQKLEHAESKKVSYYFIQLAAELDPRNEDAVYASEMIRLDHGPADWTSLTGDAP